MPYYQSPATQFIYFTVSSSFVLHDLRFDSLTPVRRQPVVTVSGKSLRLVFG